MRVALALTVCLALARPALGQTADNVLVVINTDSPASVEVGEYYVTKRSVPAGNVVKLKAPVTDVVSRADYARTIEGPIGAWLYAHGLEDQILFIVLTKGVPLRVSGSAGRDGTVASVDSELTLLYRKLLGVNPPIVGRVDNPVYMGDRAMNTAAPFTHANWDIYLVTRLDGFTVADAKGLVDRALAPAATGTIVLDQKATLIDRGGDGWMATTAERLKGGIAPVALETTTQTAAAAAPVLGYYSWGSNDPANQLRRFGLTFAPGAIGGLFVSTDGRTFDEPPATWKPSPPSGGPPFKGSFQSLAGDLIRDGITGVSAHVEEPYLDATVRPQILFPAYVAGFTLAESFYLGMPYLSWQSIVIGDPLCRPFARNPLTALDIAKPIDPETELPGLFSQRRLALETAGGLNAAAVKLVLKKDAQVARGDRANVEALLIKATEVEPKYVGAHLQLAQLYEDRKDYAKAVERYRQVLVVTPDDSSALNNLAYDLAVYLGKPQDALPLAERAYRLSKQTPESADTIGWIQHLLGDNGAASFFLDRALRGLPNHPDVLIHAATVQAALNDIARARALLAAAERLGETVTSRDDFKALSAALRKP